MTEDQMDIKDDQLQKIRKEVEVIANGVTENTNRLMLHYREEADRYAMQKVCGTGFISRWFRLC